VIKLYRKIYDAVNAYTAEYSPMNIIRSNFHAISEEAYRSAQPSPKQLRRYHARYGLKTVVNVRGRKDDSKIQREEEAVCEALGITLRYIHLHSRNIPAHETLEETKALIEGIEYPALFHCKAGSDRAGLISALYLYFKKGIMPHESRQLRFWPFGHMRYARTGMLDFFFARFEASGERSLMQFSRQIDRPAMERSFRAMPILDWFSKKVMGQE
jgi:protein tyrosine phosphatase (PTP) superfamily phosphohydrolase (DUF442 family)